MQKYCLALLAMGLVSGGLGCGSSSGVGQVTGRVTYRGEPVTKGAVVFEDNERGISVNAPLGGDGAFTARTHDLPGLPPGTYKLAVSPRTFGDGSAPLVVDPNSTATPTTIIPEKYQQSATSGLTTVVAPGSNPPLKIELTD
jgi:hypothetical protein